MTAPHPMISYVELPAGDIAATKRFYQDAFAWSWTDYGPTYAAFEGGAVEVGLNAGGTPGPVPDQGAEDGVGPLVLLESNDLDETLQRVRSAGGTIRSEPYRYPGGRRFHFVDPAGNTLGVYQSDPPQ